MNNLKKTTSKPRISIIIRAYNEEKHIGRLLDNILEQSLEDWEIILVDSGSMDDTRKVASQYPVNIVHIEPEQFTFGCSLNMGIEKAQGELIVIISAHCCPIQNDWLERLTTPLEDPEIAVSYGKQRGGESNHYSEHQFFREYFPDQSQKKQGQPYTHNANAAIRRSLWEEHPYNENLTGLEDLAWSSWAKEEGYEISYVAEAEIIHLHDERPMQICNRYRREAIALKQILPQSQFRFRDFINMWVYKCFSDWSQAMEDGVFAKEWFNVMWFRFMQYLGTWFGYQYSGKIDSRLHKKFYYPPHILSQKNNEFDGSQAIDFDKQMGKE